MATGEMDRLMDNARVRLPGALDSAIQAELLTVMDTFFKHTNCWTEEVEINVGPASGTPVTEPDNYTFAFATANGTPIRLLYVVNADGQPMRASMPIPGEIAVAYLPNQPETWTAKVVLTVETTVTSEGYPSFPNWVLEKWGSELLDGLLGRMMSQPAKPYSSLQTGALHYRMFRNLLSRAKTETARQNTYAAQPWRFPQTFNKVR